MQKDRKWEVLHKTPVKNQESLLKILLDNRGIKTKKEVEDFLDPKLKDVSAKSVGIDDKQL